MARGKGITATAHPPKGAAPPLNDAAGVASRPIVRPPHRRSFGLRRELATADAFGLSIAFFASFLAWRYGTPIGSPRFAFEALLFLLTLPIWILYAKALGLYTHDDARADHSTADEVLGVVNLVTIGTWFVFVSAWATDLSHPQLGRLITFWALALLLVFSGRVLVRAYAKRTPMYVQQSIIIGAGHVGQLVARKIQQHPEYGIHLVGFVDENPRARRAEVTSIPMLGGIDDVAGIVARHRIDRVIVAFSGTPDATTMELVRTLRDQELIVDVVPRLYELVGPHAEVHLLEGLALVTLPPARIPRGSLMAKRVMDICGAAVLLLVSAPVFAVAALRIKRESPGPVFFRQTRLGVNQRRFTTLKFRTMRVDTDHAEHRDYIRRTMTADATANADGTYKLAREASVTPFGRFLRKTSLDELPQLINVLRGDMSLVGPRPCIEYETEFFQPHHFDRFLVPQGLTGLWQVTARANSTFGEALEMDVAYVRGWSLGLDLRLIFRTPVALLRQRRATA